MSDTINENSARLIKLPNIFRAAVPITLLFLLSACQTIGGLTDQPPAESKPAPIAEKQPDPQAPVAAAPAPISPEKLAAETLLTKQVPTDQMMGRTIEPSLTLNRPITEVQKTPIRIALLLPFSGTHKKIGDDLLKAANIALFDHNNTQLK
ncbi:MAG: hypothetical protein JKY04_03560, partial [Sneathiella sp.]|nr:hypothetical protein [Sneathiella sp.]